MKISAHPHGAQKEGRLRPNEWQDALVWSGKATDAGEILRGRANLADTNRRLERSNRDLHHFASVVAHDLKSPLSTISAMSTWLREEYGDRLDLNAQEYLRFMEKAVRRMNTLVSAAFEYSRAEADDQAAVERVNSAESLDWALANLHSEIRDSTAVITSDRLPEIMVREHELAQLFQNLVSNAIRYAKPGEAPRVHVAATESEQGWIFSVTDNGIGIEPGQFERIFNLFERLNADSPGIGLGLAICQKIVERHGGRIWVESEVNQGSTFRFTIPK